MDLKTLLNSINARVYGKVSPVEVRSITKNSRCVGSGDIFIAQKGMKYDGNDFAEEAIQNGAIAIASSFYNPFLPIVQIIAEDLLSLEAELSAKCYEYPSKKIAVIGVTGTNGKTTISHLVHFLISHSGQRAGLIGTIAHDLGDSRIQDSFTTPESCLLQKYLAEMVKNRVSVAAMEVSSIGLVSHRLDYVDFDMGIVSNVTSDHLDFHGTIDRYLEAKLLLFSSLKEQGVAIVNADLPYADRFLSATQARTLTYGIDTPSDYQACHISFSRSGAHYEIVHEGQSVPCRSPLIGQYNVYNVLAAVAAVHQKIGGDLGTLVSLIAKAPPPRGRLEPILSGPCPIYIDYAHTPDALDNVCKTLHALLPDQGRLIVVFGCGGDRDRSKRSQMAQVVETYGISVVTSDNPRTEDPQNIIQDICSGFMTRNFFIEIDRKQAIQYALSIALHQDIVLIAGKGHETYQIFKHQTIAFDDREVVYEVLASHV